MGKDLKIRKSNQLIEAAYSGKSIHKLRLLHVAIKHVDKHTTHKTKIRIDAADYADLINRDNSGKLYQELMRATDDLITSIITVPLYHEGTTKRRGKSSMPICAKSDYMDGEGAVEIRFNEWALPYIQELKSHYKELDLQTIMAMKSGYGIRLYELCTLWEFNGGKEISIDDFKKLLKIEKLYKNNVKELKRRVINPAIEDVNKNSEISVAVGYRKAGTRITHIQFQIMRKLTEKQSKAELLDGITDGEKFIMEGGSIENYTTKAARAGAYKGLTRPEAIKQARKEIEAGIFRDLKTGKIIKRNQEDQAT